MADKRRVYMDSCCFIDAVKQSIGLTLNTDREKDVWHIKQLLQAHRDNEIAVFTSALAIAECTHVDGDYSQKVKNEFTRLLMSGQYLTLVQPTPFILIDARELRWDRNIALSGADSIHVASALDRQCEEFITTDNQVAKLNKNAALIQTGLKAMAGRDTICLPEKYRQGALNV